MYMYVHVYMYMYVCAPWPSNWKFIDRVTANLFILLYSRTCQACLKRVNEPRVVASVYMPTCAVCTYAFQAICVGKVKSHSVLLLSIKSRLKSVL